MDEQRLKDLAQRRVMVKKAEDAAIEERRQIDADIAELLKDADKPEGTVNQKTEGFKVSVTYGVTRKLDTKAIQADWGNLPPVIKDCVNWKAELSTTKFRNLDDQDVLALSAYMESKPSSPTVKVEILA